MGTAVRLLLVICLLGAHTPVCKVAAVSSLVTHRTSPSQVPTDPAPKCKKGCCPAACPTTPSSPKPDRETPAKPSCPKNCLSPLCSVPPALVSFPELVVEDLGPTGHVVAESQTSAADVFRCPLDRPPRA